MLTLFAIPKAFIGHTGIIQRNAIQSWTKLGLSCEILLLGEDDGTKDIAGEFGLAHVPEIDRNQFGTPTLDSIFKQAEAAACNNLMCYVNADIILMSDFMRAAQRADQRSEWFLMSGQRWDLEVNHPLDFEAGWEKRLRESVEKNGRLHQQTGTDYYLYTKGVMDNIPPFAIGRTAWDQWLHYRARLSKADLIDSTRVVMDVHQSHDYSHHPEGKKGVWSGPEAIINLELAEGRRHLFSIKDRTLVMNPTGIKPALDLWNLWRLLRTFEILHASTPLPLRMIVKTANNAIDLLNTIAITLRLRKIYDSP